MMLAFLGLDPATAEKVGGEWLVKVVLPARAFTLLDGVLLTLL